MVAFVAASESVPRSDRLVMSVLLAALYALALLLAHLVIRLILVVTARTLPQHHRLEGGLVAGFVTINALLLPFGRKVLVVPETTWFLTLNWVGEALVLASSFFTVVVMAAASSSIRLSGVWVRRLLASLAVLAYSVPGTSVRSREGPLPPVVSSPVGAHPIVLFAVDGLDRDVLERALQTGRLPAFKALAENSFRAVLDNNNFGLSPPIWTSVATGKAPPAHGIRDFTLTESPLLQAPAVWVRQAPPSLGVGSIMSALARLGLTNKRLVDGRDRRGPSIWQILSAHGYRSLVIEYMTSYPAEKVIGAFIARDTYVAARSGRPLLGFEHPAGFVARSGVIVERLPREADLIKEAEEEFKFTEAVARAAVASDTFDIVTIYTRWIDTFNHQMTLADYDEIMAGRFSSPRPADLLAALVHIDELLGHVRSRLPNSNIILLSDHGLQPVFRGTRWPAGDVNILSAEGIDRVSFPVRRVLQHLYASPGLVVASGPDIAAGTGVVRPEDIAPSLLSHFRLPRGRDMRGTSLPGLGGRTEALIEIETYDHAVPNARVDAGMAADLDGVRERLRALGYLR